MNGGATGCTARRCALALAVLGVACVPGGPGPTGTDDGAAYSVTLAWDAPRSDAEGVPLTDLAGYRLYYSPSSPIDPATAHVVELGTTTVHKIMDLAAGTYHVAVSAVDEAGNESERTPELSIRVGPP